MKVVCETQRLLLRQFIPTDAEEILSMYSNLKLIEHTGDPLMTRLDEAEEFVNKKIINGQYSNDQIGYLALHEKKSGRFIGWLGLEKIANEHQIKACLKPKFWKKGYATEAFKGLFQFIYDSIKINELTVEFNANDDSANRLAHKLGFSFPPKENEDHRNIKRGILQREHFKIA